METTSTDGPTLVVKNLSKQYKTGLWANQDISLTAKPGEILGILGPNGAGKTTLVRQITTELLPTSGSVTVLGRDAVRESTKVKNLLGVVPQEAVLFDYLTVYQHLRIFAKLRGFTARNGKKRAEELVNELRLQEHRDVAIRNLSGGLRRRILVGISALAHPPLIVLDEPTTGLDPQSRQDLWLSLRRYRDSGTTILITTHYMEEAEALCDRVGIISEGRLLALDSVSNLRSAYGYEYKITFVEPGEVLKDTGIGGPVVNSSPVIYYGANRENLVARVRARGVQEFVVSQATLEDVYLKLTGRPESRDVPVN